MIELQFQDNEIFQLAVNLVQHRFQKQQTMS